MHRASGAEKVKLPVHPSSIASSPGLGYCAPRAHLYHWEPIFHKSQPSLPPLNQNTHCNTNSVRISLHQKEYFRKLQIQTGNVLGDVNIQVANSLQLL